jgi:nondiscriminating glutamyl-tRNA synthetase
MTDTTPTKPIRVRLAPSPTGYIHIGTLRTALFDFLFAKKQGGSVILRIEDTDQNRFVEGAIENMLSVFKKMGIIFDEGYYLGDDNHVHEKGEYGPYLQSRRLDIYKEHVQTLIENGHAYYCFCDEARLDELRKEQIALKKPPMYDRHCRNLPKEEVEQKLLEQKEHGGTLVVRQAIPLEGQTVIHDLIYGDVTYDHKVIDDQILVKSDGFPTYHLAVVVDDHLMQISHVIRGEEWIPSTPKHILLFNALGWEVPEFAHLPLILNPDKTKLSKRQGDVAVEDYLEKGYLKDALLNFIVFLGWNPKTEQEIFSFDELKEQFDLAKVNKSGAVFDTSKLDWINGLYIRQLSSESLTDMLIPYWEEAGYIEQSNGTITIKTFDGKQIEKKYLQEITELEQERLKKLSEIGERTSYFFSKPTLDSFMLVWRKSDAADAKEKLAQLAEKFKSLSDDVLADKEKLEAEIKTYITENGFDTGSVLWPLRVALTGLQASPGPFEVASVLAKGLGKQEVIDRLVTASEAV